MKNNHTLLRKLLYSCLFLLASSGLFAQANFAGTWTLNESKSDFGGSQFRMASNSMVVTQDAGILSVTSTRPGRDGGDMTTSAKYKLDGSVSENTGFMDNVSKTTVTWSADKTAMTLTTTMTFDMGGESREMKTTEVWKLAEGGKVLTVTSTRMGRDGEMKTVAAYDKK